LALQAYTELGELAPQAHCLNNLAVQAFGAGRWEEALTKYRLATEIFHRIGDTAWEAGCLFNQMELLVRQRRYADAQSLLPDVLRIARAVHDDELVALAQREQGQLLAHQGQVDQAVHLLTETRARFEELGEPEEARTTDLALADILLLGGRVEEATAVLDEVVAGLDLAEMLAVSASFHLLTARASKAAGDYSGARDHLSTGLNAAEGSGNVYTRGLLLAELAEVTKNLQDPEAADLARQASEVLGALGVLG
jgi:tetratricopeptide (TPR) repeat protein